VFAGIWQKIASLSVARATNTNPPPPWGNEPMKYYGSWWTFAYNTVGLLAMGDGECGAWVHFMQDVLRAQGLSDTGTVRSYQAVNDDPEKTMLIKDWSLTGGAHGEPGWPYLNVFPAGDGPPYDGSHFTYRYEEVHDESGRPGQGNTQNPLSRFVWHYQIEVGSTVYDPSYGTFYGGEAAWRADAVWGYAWRKLSSVDENAIGVDVDGDGQRTVFTSLVDVIKQGP
jgi:hypothetical protein